jgi:hypothetical protein
MPTNLPDPRNRKSDENREAFLTALFVVMRVAMAIAFTMVVWSFFANR